MSVQRYHRWIRAIAEDPRTDIEGVIQHIHKHCGAELDESFSNDDMVNWIASMENLIAISKVLLRVTVRPTEHLARLEEQVAKHPESRTPEPKRVSYDSSERD